MTGVAWIGKSKNHKKPKSPDLGQWIISPSSNQTKQTKHSTPQKKKKKIPLAIKLRVFRVFDFVFVLWGAWLWFCFCQESRIKKGIIKTTARRYFVSSYIRAC